MYFCETVEGKISKINISLANPNIEEVINGLSYPSSIALYGNELYISEESAYKISKINITDTNPSVTNVITGFNARGILISGNNLYVSGNNEVSKIDITQTSPQLTSVASGFCCVAGDIELNGNDLYTSMLQSGDIYKSTLSSLSVESFENNSFKVFPNPSLDFIQVKNLDKEQNYVIHNNTGSQIFAGKILNNKTIDIKHLKSGLYFLRFENGNIIKFLKK